MSAFMNSVRLKSLFLHFFDVHFLEEKGKMSLNPHFQREMRIATRMAVATSETVYIPAASYFESGFCRVILSEFEELIGLGMIVLLGSSTSLEDYVLERQDEGFYRPGSDQHIWYKAQYALEKLPTYIRRERSATKDIIDHWRSTVDDQSLIRRLHDAAPELSSSLEKRLDIVPNELGRLAFIPEHVYEILDLAGAPSLVRARIRDVINQGYFDSYARGLGAGFITDLRYLSSTFELPSYGTNLSYPSLQRLLLEKDKLKEFSTCSPFSLGSIIDAVGWQNSALPITTPPVITPANATIYLPNQPIMTISAVPPLEVQSSTKPLKILCIAAAQVELKALTVKFADLFECEPKTRFIGQDKRYAASKFTDPKNGSEWYVATLAQQGNVEASGGVAALSHALNPDLILMVGMCMGMPGRSLKIGTVVIPSEVVGFDHERFKNGETQHRPHFGIAANGFQRIARIVATTDRDYETVVDKAVASASVKIEDPDAPLIQAITKAFSDVIAFDMESFGFYRGVPEGSQSLWIKGVADTGEPQSSTMDGRDSKQVAQKTATYNAGDFAVEVVRAWHEATTSQD
ncbi:hypothetical protein CRN80_00550 [Pseudomonas sp. FDAARGOS_380]|uniref:phosphorylase family protein n=1 Tax=unclassified Pseudomonas TaxID=196821 RepID=UPI000BFDB8F8|nr:MULTISPECIES: hypothetical protein [unclassified Pseudomonas]ATN08248.1 hypothetical protein CRN80_00550 [Pseudomonas sp. FDAARGOS_380]